MPASDHARLTSITRQVTFVVITDGGRPDGLQAAIHSVDEVASDAQRIVVLQRCEPPAGLQADGWTMLADDGIGLSRARNRAIPELDRHWVQFLDDDAELVPWWRDAQAAAVLEEGHAAIGFRMVDSDSGRSLVPFAEHAHQIDIGSVAHSVIEPSLVLSARALRDIGGFEETLGVGTFHGSDEGINLCVRLIDAGGTIQYSPVVGVHHPTPDDVVDPSKKRSYGRGTGRLLWLHRRHRAIWYYVAGSLLAPIVRPYRRGMSRTRFTGRWARSWGILEGLATSAVGRVTRQPDTSGAERDRP